MAEETARLHCNRDSGPGRKQRVLEASDTHCSVAFTINRQHRQQASDSSAGAHLAPRERMVLALDVLEHLRRLRTHLRKLQPAQRRGQRAARMRAAVLRAVATRTDARFKSI